MRPTERLRRHLHRLPERRDLLHEQLLHADVRRGHLRRPQRLRWHLQRLSKRRDLLHE
jgi:hypothetical protein